MTLKELNEYMLQKGVTKDYEIYIKGYDEDGWFQTILREAEPTVDYTNKIIIL